MEFRNHLRTEHNIINRSGGIVFTDQELLSMIEAIRACLVASNERGTVVSHHIPANRSGIAVYEPAADARLIVRRFDTSPMTSTNARIGKTLTRFLLASSENALGLL